MAHLLRIFFVWAITAVLLAQPAASQNALNKAKDREPSAVPKGNQDMAFAIWTAKSKLAEFLALKRSPKLGMSNFIVKVGVHDPRSGETEFFWINPFTQNGEIFSGRINNTPFAVKNIVAGQTIRFKESEIVDWEYTLEGRRVGNHTACAIIKREPKERQVAYIKQLRITCDFWLN